MEGKLYIDKTREYNNRFPLSESTNVTYNAIVCNAKGDIWKLEDIKLNFDMPLESQNISMFNLWANTSIHTHPKGVIVSRGLGDSDESLFRLGFHKVLELRKVITVETESTTAYKLPVPDEKTNL